MTTTISNPRLSSANSPHGGFHSPGEFLAAVMRAATSAGCEVDERLRPTATAGSDEAGTYSDPAGGFLVPKAVIGPLLTVPVFDPVGTRTTAVIMPFPECAVPARTDADHSTSASGGIVARRRAETQTTDPSRMEAEQVRFVASTLWCLSYSTEELVADALAPFGELLSIAVQNEFAATKMRERLHGTGVGQCEGIVNAACTITVDAELGQAAGTIVGLNVAKMAARCWRYHNEGIWLANQESYPALLGTFVESGSGPIRLYHSSEVEGSPDTLAGRPIFYSEECSALGDAGDLICGNWSQYLDATYRPFQKAESIHVRFDTVERCFKFFERGDGRCWWRSAITPRNGSDTLSPFVTLGAR